MRIAVLGAGAWGTTVASLLAGHHDCTIWARDPELAREIYERDANSRYLPGFALPSTLKATADLEKAVHDIDLLVVGVPTHGFRAVLADARPWLRPWIPVVSLAKGFERDSLLRMTQLVREELPGHPAAALSGPNLAKEIMAGAGRGECHSDRRPRGGPGASVRHAARPVPDLHQRRRDRMRARRRAQERGGDRDRHRAGAGRGGQYAGPRWSAAGWPSLPGWAWPWAGRRRPSPAWPAWGT